MTGHTPPRSPVGACPLLLCWFRYAHAHAHANAHAHPTSHWFSRNLVEPSPFPCMRPTPRPSPSAPRPLPPPPNPSPPPFPTRTSCPPAGPPPAPPAPPPAPAPPGRRRCSRRCGWPGTARPRRRRWACGAGAHAGSPPCAEVYVCVLNKKTEHVCVCVEGVWVCAGWVGGL